MTATIYFVLSVVLCGVLGYPAQPSLGLPTREHLLEVSSIKQTGLPTREHLLKVSSIKQTDVQRRDVGTEAHLSSHPDLTQVVTSRPVYSSDFNVRQDPPPSEDDLQRNRKRRDASASQEEDDSDMYMEPIEIEKTEVKSTTASESPKVAETTTATKDNQQMGQHFFPSFAPVFSLGHSRPHQLFHQEPFYSKPRSSHSLGSDYNPFRAYRESSYKIPITIEDDAISTNILGSGNFGVLRGGTYYNEDDEYGGLFSPHYSNNGHGRPYSSNPRPQKYSSGDFFANFRDFADINTPTKASYSEYVVVYVNKNATKADEGQTITPGNINKPKNIFEQLALLDRDDDGESSPTTEDTTAQKKQSLHKRKLALLKQEKLNKQKKSYYKNKEAGKDFLEPLLALS